MLVRLFAAALVSITAMPLAFANAINDFTQGMQEHSGFFTFYYSPAKDKVYLAVSQFEQPFLFQSSLPQGMGSNDIGLDRGQLGDTRLVQFERYGNKVLLKQLNTQYRATSANPAEQRSIDEAFADSVIAGFSIEAEESGEVLLDYSDFLFSDIHNISETLQKGGEGSYVVDKTRSGVYQLRSKAFPDNTELEALVTYGGKPTGKYVSQVTPDPHSISVHLHHSLIRLPDDNYQPRAFHPFSGFWKLSYQDYSAPLAASMETSFIPRHRLNKKNPAAKSSEAIKPIIYYLDPGIPEPVMSALKEGASWWAQAFDAIGYKNAFQVKVLPKDADPMDVRYNVIQWVHRATRGWSYGSSVVDPRTGEIIKGHVTLGSLRVRQDYLIALGLTSPFTSPNADTKPQQEMALARIRQLAAHEVGHTLGISHNFASSVNQRASVMDYPHPKVSVVNGDISLEGAYAVGMGDWDKQVIAYGYQDFGSATKEAKGLNAVITQSHQKGLQYQSDPDSRPVSGANPDGHLWDNGADPIAELERLSEVRKIALEKFGLNSLPEGEALSSLQERLVPIYLLHRYQVEAVAKLLGGQAYEYEIKADGSEPKGISWVDQDTQRKAFAALVDTLSMDFLSLPNAVKKWVTPKAYGDERNRESFVGRTGLVFDPLSAAEASAANTLKFIFDPARLNRISACQQNWPNFQLTELMNSLFSATIKRQPQAKELVLQQRVNFLVLNAVMNAVNQPGVAPEVKAQLLLSVESLHEWMKIAKQRPYVGIMAKQLDLYWQTGEWKGKFEPIPMPPGSPI